MQLKKTSPSEITFIDYGLKIIIRDKGTIDLDLEALNKALYEKKKKLEQRRIADAKREAREFPTVLKAVEKLDAEGIYPSFSRVNEEVGRWVFNRNRIAALKLLGYYKPAEGTRYKKL